MNAQPVQIPSVLARESSAPAACGCDEGQASAQLHGLSKLSKSGLLVDRRPKAVCCPIIGKLGLSY